MASAKKAADDKEVLTRFERVNEEKAQLSALVHPENAGFREKVIPKEVDDKKLFIYKCPEPCGNSHFRHAGYLRVLLPYIEPGGDHRMSCDPHQVMVCTTCRKSTIWVNGQMYDVSDRVDLKAWEKSEKELHAATGPGGQC